MFQPIYQRRLFESKILFKFIEIYQSSSFHSNFRRHITDSVHKLDSTIDSQQSLLRSFGIKNRLKKLEKYESFVFRSFFGEIDSDYLIFPNLVNSTQSKKLFSDQSDFIKKNFQNLFNDHQKLLKLGVYNLDSFSETEKTYLFEAIGASFLTSYRNSLDSSALNINQKSLIPSESIVLTDSFIRSYRDHQYFLFLVKRLIQKNSIISNSMDASTNIFIKNNFERKSSDSEIGVAIDEPNDSFLPPTHFFWISTAKFDPETDTWIMSGKKSKIIKNRYENFIVSCRIESDDQESHDQGLGLFLIPSESVRIESDGSDNYGNKFIRITFDKLKMSRKDCEILVDKTGNQILNIQSTNHLLNVAVLLGLMKQLHNDIFQFKINEKYCHNQLMRSCLAEITSLIYSIESMLYFTSSHFDIFGLDRIDLHLEALILQILGAEYCQKSIKTILFLFGPKTLSSIFSMDILNLLNGLLDSSLSNRMLLASYGLRHLGRWRFDHIVKMRLKDIYTQHNLKYKLSSNYKKKIDDRFENCKDDFKKLDELDLSLKDCCDQLRSVLQTETEIGNHLLASHGKKCIEKQISLNRFATIIISCYEMVSVISRTNAYLSDEKNRSASNFQNELSLCKLICSDAFKKVTTAKKIVYEIVDYSEERFFSNINQSNIRSNGYFPMPTFDRVL
ncbi:hypothetical protein NH340_JMT06087 [Sarcoptes scabiei]|uniref:ACAD9/ACADV-like C-terminal domain-containing protein n=1 Tax=Sarcoptes scabiei TaxID=52283 RepID=A0A834R6J1_SARSC|nr:hypothetical protein NH340_JMT06087 [Sarcoptes scabiei]